MGLDKKTMILVGTILLVIVGFNYVQKYVPAVRSIANPA